ncbi:MAG: MTAP family purine nucleoside phosphorylase [Spirochaetaceae bacterium]|nr:MTAP family purine nucleoside phosphorylase [Spirochaetaceae bacterium]
MKAIIGGSGIDKILDITGIQYIETKYGKAKYYKENNIIYVLRHGENHEYPPHLVNYKANVEALSMLGVDECISIYCVGSISNKFPPGISTIMCDFLDFTTRGNKTFSEVGNVFHTDMVDIFDESLQTKIVNKSKDFGIDMHLGGIYVATEGPRFESPAEIRMYSLLGGDFVGMTAIPEITLMKEKKIKIASIAYSINWCSGITGDSQIDFVSDEEVQNISTNLLNICRKVLLK